MSRAKIGNSAITLPSSTASMSSTMAPSTTLRRATKVTPLNNVFRSSDGRAEAVRSMATVIIASPAVNQITAQTENTSVGLSAIRMPPSAGPATTAVCEPDVEAATALGSTLAGTILGSTVCTLGCSKARPVPTTKAMASSRFGVRWPVKLATASTATAAASTTSPMKVTQRRSNRSATWPVNGNRQIAGMNCTSPIEAEPERAAGQRIHLPADRDHMDLQRDRRGDPHIEVTDKGRMAPKRYCRGGITRRHCSRCLSVMAQLVPAVRAQMPCFSGCPGRMGMTDGPRSAFRLQAGLPSHSSRSERRLVEPRGVEPLTSSLRTRRSPN